MLLKPKNANQLKLMIFFNWKCASVDATLVFRMSQTYTIKILVTPNRAPLNHLTHCSVECRGLLGSGCEWEEE